MTIVALPERLAALGDALDLADDDLAPHVLRRLDATPTPLRRRAVAVAVVLATVLGAVVHPASRGAIARWFDLDGVRIEHRPDLSLPPPAPVRDRPGPGESIVVVVDGREVLVSAIRGSFDAVLIEKVIGPGTALEEVEVDGALGLWIDGAPHAVLYEVPGEGIVEERVAGNTLLWQDGDLLRRVEGFDRLAEALAFADAGT